MVQLQSIANVARQSRNRGKVHVFLGHPLADLCDTTTVEPGNTYSPGVWTCGVSLCLVVGDQIYVPDRLTEGEIVWGFGDDDGRTPPTIRATYSAGGIKVTHELCHLGGEGAEGVDFNRVVFEAPTEQTATVCIIVKEVGPAGGVIKSIECNTDNGSLLLNGTRKLDVESPAMACRVFEGADQEDSLAVLYADVALAPDAPVELRFKTEHGFDDRAFAKAIPKLRPYAAVSVGQAFSQIEEAWEQDLPGRVFAPDPRVEQVWQACVYHVFAAMEAGLPRISAVNYPIFWIRDAIIILRALDLIGRPDLARIGNDYLAPLDFAGGFGAESDAPGEGIWALVNHARMQYDLEWLRGVYPHLRRRISWLQRMRRTAEPIRALSENRTAGAYNSPGSSILCLAAENGCIHGRMDGHSPDFYINCWAIAGFREAIWAAEQLGEMADATAWQTEANELERAVYEHLLPKYGNERDPVVAPYPTGALAGKPYHEALRDRFEDWYRANRLDKEGRRKREPLWTYFEAAQIHNALLLGLKEEAWVCLDGMLSDACEPWNISAWVEGRPGTGNNLPFRNNQGARGWLREDRALGGNMPHNWTGAEMLTCLRTVFVVEQDDGLILGTGVPPAWLEPGSRFGVQNLPTEFGTISYTAEVGEDGELTLEYDGPENYRSAW